MQPLTLGHLIHAFINCARKKPLDNASLGRLAYWNEALGTRELAAIHPDEVDAALVQLQQRGRLRPRRGQAPQPTGAPLAPATINRFISTLGELYKHARRLRILPRNHESPLKGIERAPEPVDPDRYFRPEQIEALIAIARVLDRRWRRMPALIRLGFVTGIRIGNLQALRWCDVNLEEKTVQVGKTKNGDPNYAPITQAVVEELRKLGKPASDAELIFRSKRRADRPHNFRKTWAKVTAHAGLPGRNFHQIRHGTGSQLARSNVNQAGIMAAMGHRTLSASARYIHHNLADRRATVRKAFGE
jgi:integrase